MLFTITVTHTPSSRFGDDRPQALPEPRLFKCFRTRTGRRDKIVYGDVPEVVLYDEFRHSTLPHWTTREAAERNVARLTARGFTARVTEI